MDLEALEQRLDETGVGDPALVEELDAAIPLFRDHLEEFNADTVLYLVGTASLFRDPVAAYRLLISARPLMQEAGKAKKLYENQLEVWKKRSNKSQHDLQYLSIVLGVRQPLPDDPQAAGSSFADMARLLQSTDKIEPDGE